MALESGWIPKDTPALPNDTENCAHNTSSASGSLFFTIFRQEDYIGGGATATNRPASAEELVAIPCP
jgi:hypothetical protein